MTIFHEAIQAYLGFIFKIYLFDFLSTTIYKYVFKEQETIKKFNILYFYKRIPSSGLLLSADFPQISDLIRSSELI